MPRPPASVVLATLDRSDLLEDCLRSLAADLAAGDELIVIDAGADEAAAAMLAAATERAGPDAPAGVYLRSPAGKSRQLNAGARAAHGEVLLFTDDDVRIPPGWSDAMVRAFEDPSVGIAFGSVKGLSHAPGARAPVAGPPGEAPRITYAYAHGAAMAVRASALRAVGGFDERLGPGAKAYGEEHDLVLRLREAGWRVVIADAPTAEHLEWRDDHAELRTALVYERGAGAFVGSAIRRNPRHGARQLLWRLRYLGRVWRGPSGRRFALRAATAFAGGVAYGIRLRPRRFLEAS